jgi:AcrR family transcriptional regulator
VRKRNTSRDRILAIATKHFAKHGYSGTSLEQVVKDAGVTRGALYHHFKDKHELYRLVCHKMQTESVRTITAAINSASNPWEAFINAVHATIDAAAKPDVRRILFTERESVLLPKEWDELSAETNFWAMKSALENAMDQGYMERRPTHALHAVISMSISRITAIAAYSEFLSIEEVHTEFDDWLERYRIKKDSFGQI